MATVSSLEDSLGKTVIKATLHLRPKDLTQKQFHNTKIKQLVWRIVWESCLVATVQIQCFHHTYTGKLEPLPKRCVTNMSLEV